MDREEFFRTALAGALAQNGWAVTASDINIDDQDMVHVTIVNYGFHNNNEATVEASFLIGDGQEEQIRDLMESALDNLWDDAGTDQYTKDLIRRGSAQVSTETDPDNIFSVHIYADDEFIRTENVREIMRLTDFARESVGLLCNNVLVPYAAHELNVSYQNRAVTIGTIDPKGNLNDGIVVHAVDNRNVIASVIRNDARMPYEHYPLSEGEGNNRTFTIDGSTYSLADIKPVERSAEQDGPSQEIHDEVLHRIQNSLNGRMQFMKVCNYLNDHDIPFELSEQNGTEKLTVYTGDKEGHVWFDVSHDIGSEELTVNEGLIFDPEIDVLEHGLNGQDVIDRIETLDCTVGVCKVSDDLSLTIHQLEPSDGDNPGWVLVSGTIGDTEKIAPKIYAVQYNEKDEPGIIWHGQEAKLKDVTWLDGPGMDEGPVWGSEKFLASFRATVEQERRIQEDVGGPDEGGNSRYEDNPNHNPHKDSITEGRNNKMPEEVDSQQGQTEQKKRNYISITFANGLRHDYVNQEGVKKVQIDIPSQDSEDKRPWEYFKSGADFVHPSQEKKGFFVVNVPEDGQTKLSRRVPTGEQNEQGKNIYRTETRTVTNIELQQMARAVEPHKDEITIEFSKGMVKEPTFISKKGTEMSNILTQQQIDGQKVWSEFALPTAWLDDRKSEKTYCVFIPKNASTNLKTSIPTGEIDQNGKKIYTKEERMVPNMELKGIVEAYKKEKVKDRLGKGNESIAKGNESIADKPKSQVRNVNKDVLS